MDTNSTSDYQRYKEVALAAAQKAGAILARHVGCHVNIRAKDDIGRNLVSNADLESEKIIIAEIKKYYPSHNIVAEESAREDNSSEYTWIIDPLDGTMNFLRGFPIFSVSIALARGEDVIVGVVFNPITKELFVAERGKGAYLLDKPIHVSSRATLAQAVVAQNIDNSPQKREIYLHNLQNLFQEVEGFRQFHSTALEMCNVACGRTEAFILNGANSWDIAAGALIIEEAGGKVTSSDGGAWCWRRPTLVTSNGLIHQELFKKLK